MACYLSLAPNPTPPPPLGGHVPTGTLPAPACLSLAPCCRCVSDSDSGSHKNGTETAQPYGTAVRMEVCGVERSVTAWRYARLAAAAAMSSLSCGQAARASSGNARPLFGSIACLHAILLWEGHRAHPPRGTTHCGAAGNGRRTRVLALVPPVCGLLYRTQYVLLACMPRGWPKLCPWQMLMGAPHCSETGSVADTGRWQGTGSRRPGRPKPPFWSLTVPPP